MNKSRTQQVEEDDYSASSVENDITTSLQDDLILSKYSAEMGSHAYMPKTFAGIDTAKLGFHIVGQKTSSYMELKNKLIKEAATLEVEDRMQGVRYLCSIPYTNGTAHCLEAAMSVVGDSSIDIYKRFYFFSNKDKYFRLDDHVVYYLYGGFFKYGERMGPVKVPYELMFLTVDHILQNYGSEMASRQNALNWCLDIIENDFEDDGSKIKALHTLVQYGEQDEQAYAMDQCEQLFEIDDPLQVEIDDLDVRDILRALRTKHTVDEVDSADALFQLLTTEEPLIPDIYESLEIFFNETVNTNDVRYEGIRISDVMILLHKELMSFDKWIRADCINSIIRIACDESIGEEDLIPEFIRVLSNFTQPVQFKLEPDMYVRLRHEIFAALNEAMMNLPSDTDQNVVFEARRGTDKAAVNEFLLLCVDDEKANVYKQVHDSLSRAQFDDYWEKICKEWANSG